MRFSDPEAAGSGRGSGEVYTHGTDALVCSSGGQRAAAGGDHLGPAARHTAILSPCGFRLCISGGERRHDRRRATAEDTEGSRASVRQRQRGRGSGPIWRLAIGAFLCVLLHWGVAMGVEETPIAPVMLTSKTVEFSWFVPKNPTEEPHGYPDVLQ